MNLTVYFTVLTTRLMYEFYVHMYIQPRQFHSNIQNEIHSNQMNSSTPHSPLHPRRFLSLSHTLVRNFRNQIGIWLILSHTLTFAIFTLCFWVKKIVCDCVCVLQQLRRNSICEWVYVCVFVFWFANQICSI